MSEHAARPNLIRIIDGKPMVAGSDPWRAADLDPDGTALLSPYRILEVKSLLARPALLSGVNGPIGVTLAPDEDPEVLREALPRLGLVTIQFPKFTDGRGYSSAYLLRRRLGWQGELRAVGDVLQDQLFALRRVGFDSFELRADRDPQAALAGFSVFTRSYQGSVDEALPAFRRAGWPA